LNHQFNSAADCLIYLLKCDLLWVLGGHTVVAFHLPYITSKVAASAQILNG